MKVYFSSISKQAFKALVSLRTTVFCLLFLAALTLWGTLYQVENGLYAAQERFFHSWVLFVGGFIPFPGVKLVLILLSLNLLGTMLQRIRYTLKNAGLVLIHGGILVLFLGAGFSYYFARESFITLYEGQESSWAASYHTWQLAAIGQQVSGSGSAAMIEQSRDLALIGTGDRIAFDKFGIVIGIDAVYRNALLPPSGRADSLIGQRPHAEPSKNMPGLVLSATGPDGRARTITLWGAASRPTPLEIGHGTVYFVLRHTPVSLPRSLKLLDFTKKDYPGTAMARSFESRLLVKGEGIDREVVVSMNRPLRYRNLSFFQTSYSQEDGVESSTLAVVQNPAKAFPYVASGLLSGGLLLHFLLRFVATLRKRRERP